jgi:hypothetical protein
MSHDLAEIAAILDRAADHIDTVGWYQDLLFDGAQSFTTPESQCRVCALGAINVALHGTPNFVDGEEIGAHDVADYVDQHRGDSLELATWNDTPGRTQAEVTAALRGTAAGLRGGAA